MTLGSTRRGLAAGAAALPTAFFIGNAQAQSSGSTLERVTSSKQLRMAVVSGSPPYFVKDLASGTWSGAAVAMAKGIASVWGAELVFVETTFGNSVLDLQSNKIDIAFALNPTQMVDLMAVADAGGIMPPKSTWFEPKLADGMVNHVLD